MDPLGRPLVVVPRRLRRAADVATLAGIAALVAARLVPAPVLRYLALGAGIGLATCIPIGIANIVVIDAARRHGAARAIGSGIGGALADGVYSSIGIFGVGPLLDRYPLVPLLLRIASSVVLVGYGVVLLRARTADVGAVPPAAASRRQLARGIGVGFGATMLNPSAIVTWVVIVGSHAAGVSTGEGAAWVAGIVAGTLAWFVVVTWLALQGRRLLRANATWLTRVVAVLVIASGVLSLAHL